MTAGLPPSLPTDLQTPAYILDAAALARNMATVSRIRREAGCKILLATKAFAFPAAFPLMRERYLKEFDTVWIDCLNGDKYKTGKQTPEGKPDPSVFSTDASREGIQVGTAIALLVRKAENANAATLRFRDLWGQTKRADLLSSFTGVLTLQDLGGVQEIDLAEVQKFVQSLSRDEGGFHGAIWDMAHDVEYSFYGLGVLGLLWSRPTFGAGLLTPPLF